MLFPSVQTLDTRIKTFLSYVKGIEEKRAAIDKWRRAFESGKILKRKEESIKSDYIQDIFNKVLGYSFSLTGSWHLEKELKTQFDGKTPDASLGYFSHDSHDKVTEDVRAVVEIKGPQVNLDKKQNRKNFAGSPVEQGFSYAYRIGEKCKWVIVTNFLELRLYRASDINKYQSFTLSELSQADKFQEFLFFLYEGQLFHEKEDSQIERLYLNRQAEQKTISGTFYAEYHALRELLFFNLHRNNKQLDWRKLFAASQKIIDRIIFICFVKDLRLVGDVLTNARKSSEESFDQATNNFWTQLLHLFSALDKGYERKRIPPFNGGLFRKDDFIHELKIRDEEILPFVEFAMKYDFHSQLNVNILGHIFEQSISDLEEMKASIQEQSPLDAQVLEELPELKASKRKRDGIYYTPDYVTKYIVKEAVGEWLEDRKKEILTELDVSELPEATKEDFMEVGTKDNTTISLLKRYYEAYQTKLSSIKVLDPACGSGAFLTEVFDFLYDEQRLVAEELRKLNTPFGQLLKDELDPFGNGVRDEWIIKKNIILHNLFGVDLNPESIEITKLSLWLKTANRTESLAVLTDNIKQGNSLIDDPKVAGEDAFQWDIEFADIMRVGGFDVVVGNPPYVRQELLMGQKEYFSLRYDVHKEGVDLFSYFYELGFKMLNNAGYLSFISNEFSKTSSGTKLRGFLQESNISLFVDISELDVFPGTTTYPVIVKLTKAENPDVEYAKVTPKNFNPATPLEIQTTTFKRESLDSNNWRFFDSNKSRILAKMEKLESVKEIFGKCFYGIKTGYNEGFIVGKGSVSDSSGKHLVSVYEGKDMSRWYCGETESDMVMFKSGWTHSQWTPTDEEDVLSDEEATQIFKEESPELFKHLKKHQKQASNRYDKGKFWWELRNCAYYTEFLKPKIVFPNLQVANKFAYDDSKAFLNAPAVFLPCAELWLLAVLNSNVCWFFLKSICVVRSGGYIEVKPQYFEQIPIPNVENKRKKELNKLVEDAISFVKGATYSRTSYLTLLTSNFPPKKPLSNKLKNQLWDLEFVDVLAELKKSEITIPARKQREWLDLFFEQRDKARNLQAQIEQTEKKIDTLVYELYDLSEEEIAIVEAG